ncbi:MAG: hypothetical protein HYY18_07240 [Planctomycetes bacterium]|nr:hypothetical protein [Planctomycetota bacterium]
MHRLAAVALAASFLLVSPTLADRGAAEQAYREGEAAMARSDPNGAQSAFSRAIEADAGWAAPWAMRGRAKMMTSNYAAAVEDYTKAIGLEPGNAQYLMWRCQSLMAMDLWAQAAEDAETLLKASPAMPQALSLHGWALVNLGDVDRGLAEQDKSIELGKNASFLLRFDGYFRKADWAAATREAEQAIAGGVPRPALHFYRVVGLVEQGKYTEARDAIQQGVQRAGNALEINLAQAYLTGAPAAGALYDADGSIRSISGAGSTTISPAINTHARTLFLAGRVHECLELLSTKGRRTNFDTLFWLGASQWKLGQFAESRVTLSDARRLNPYILKHAERVEGLKDFVASIDKELAGEGGQQADRSRLGQEMATHLLTVAEIETLVRRYQFSRAVAEYEKLLGTLKSEVRKGEVQVRLPEVKGMAGAHAKLVGAVNKGAIKAKTKVGKTDLTIVKSTETIFDFTLAGGDGKFPWAFLDPAVYCELALQALPAPDEMFGLGCLAWDAGQRPAAQKLFDDAVKKKSALKKNLDAFIARKRGLPAPEGGFVTFRGAYVTPEEKANLEKGLVSFQGQWVTPKEKEMLAKGNIQVEGKWVPGAEAELLKRGFKKYKDRWMSREEYELLRGQWEDAYTQETAHYVVKTNHTEAFAKDLAALIEVAYAEYKAFYGGEEPKLPGKEKMTLHAYKTYEDYRKYCVENKQEDHLNAAGFARSDSNVVVGWNKTSNDQQFLQTMVHEGAHLYFFRVQPAARPTSWYAEGMATYFEGFGWDGKTYKFNFISDSRLPFVRDAMKGKRHIALDALLGGDALALINSDSQKALLFYAECWALNYYLSQTENRKYREAYLAYRKAVAGGTGPSLFEFFPDAVQLERDWVEFVTGL